MERAFVVKYGKIVNVTASFGDGANLLIQTPNISYACWDIERPEEIVGFINKKIEAPEKTLDEIVSTMN